MTDITKRLAVRSALLTWLWWHHQQRLADVTPFAGRSEVADAAHARYRWLYQRGGQYDLAHPAEYCDG